MDENKETENVYKWTLRWEIRVLALDNTPPIAEFTVLTDRQDEAEQFALKAFPGRWIEQHGVLH